MAYGSVNVPGVSGKELKEVLNIANTAKAAAEAAKTAAQNAGGTAAQATAPSNTNLLWVDTANGNIIKFYDPASKTWKPVGAVWS